MNRRFLLIIFVIVILVAGGVLWAYSFQNAEDQTQVQSGPALIKISDDEVFSPIPSYDKSAIWFFNSEGRLFRINSDGSGISEYALPSTNLDFKEAIWPKTGSDFLMVGSNVEASATPVEAKAYYDSTNKIFVNLRSNIASIDWLPDGRRVAYVWKSSDGISQSLVVANADGSGFKTIADLFWSDLIIKVSPDGKRVLMYRSNQSDINKIYTVDLETGEITTAIDTGKNTAAMWVSDNSFVYEQSMSDVNKLSVHDLIAKSTRDLNLSTDLSKVTVDENGRYLYAAVPKAPNAGDNFVKLDLSTFAQEQFFIPGERVVASNLMLLGSRVYFVDAEETRLYKIENK